MNMKTLSLTTLILALVACSDVPPDACTVGNGGAGGGSVGSSVVAGTGGEGGVNSQVESCSDGKTNQSETDVDCGGYQVDHSVNGCSGCAVGKHCLVDGDCLGGTCLAGGICAGPCVPVDACQTAHMDGPSCVRTTITGCALCLDGLNRKGTFHAPSGVCCTTCWSGDVCAAESNAATCGLGGVPLCRSCGDAFQCIDGVCSP